MDRHTVVFQHIDIDTVRRTAAVGGEHGVFPVRGIVEKQVVVWRGIRESHIHRDSPVIVPLIPLRNIEVIPSYSVKSVGREIHSPAILRQERIHFISGRGHLFVQKGGKAPQSVTVNRMPYIPHTISVGSGKIDLAAAIRDIYGLGEGMSRQGVEDIRNLSPRLVLHGIIKEEILRGKPVSGNDCRTVDILHHACPVLPLQLPVFQSDSLHGILL